MRKLSFAVIFMLLVSYNVYAQRGTIEEFSIDGGSLSISIEHEDQINPTQDRWTIALGGTATFQKTDRITVTDLSEKRKGWQVRVDLSNFKNSTPIADPTCYGAELDVFVNVEEWMSFRLFDDAELLNELGQGGTLLTPVSSYGTPVSSGNYVVNNFITDSGTFDLLRVNPGYGAGEFDFYLQCNITVSEWLPNGTLIRSNDAKGLFSFESPVIVNNQSQKYQIFAATYRTTITYSVSGNPVLE